MYLQEFLTIALVHLLAVASPGPDFAVLSRYAISEGRKTGIWVALGIGSGILVHVTYSLIGVGLIIQQTPWLRQLCLLIGAAYLAYIAVLSLRAQPRAELPNNDVAIRIGKGRAWRVGFLTNALNVKATLFFMTLFSTIVSAQTPFWLQAGYGLYLTLATALWFCFLAWLLTHRRWYRWLWCHSHWVDRTMGVVLMVIVAYLLHEWVTLVA